MPASVFHFQGHRLLKATSPQRGQGPSESYFGAQNFDLHECARTTYVQHYLCSRRSVKTRTPKVHEQSPVHQRNIVACYLPMVIISVQACASLLDLIQARRVSLPGRSSEDELAPASRARPSNGPAGQTDFGQSEMQQPARE